MLVQNHVLGLLLGAVAGLIGGYIGFWIVGGPFLDASDPGTTAPGSQPVSHWHVLAVSGPFVIVMAVLGLARFGYDLTWALAIVLLTPMIYFGAIHLAVELSDILRNIPDSDENAAFLIPIGVAGAAAGGLLAFLSGLVAARFHDLLAHVAFSAILCGSVSALAIYAAQEIPAMPEVIKPWLLLTAGWQGVYVWMFAAQG